MTRRSLNTVFRKEVLVPPSNPPTDIELLQTPEHKQCPASMHICLDKKGRQKRTTRQHPHTIARPHN